MASLVTAHVRGLGLNAGSSSTKAADATTAATAAKVPSGFPAKLHRMLEDIEESDNGLEAVVSWAPHGRSFLVRNKKSFISDIMPKYFYQLKYNSFQRQLNLYGFKKIQNQGQDKGSFYHEFFLRGMPDLANLITRGKGKGDTGRPKATEPEPNFFAMEPLPSTKKKRRTIPTTSTTTTQDRRGCCGSYISPRESMLQQASESMHNRDANTGRLSGGRAGAGAGAGAVNNNGGEPAPAIAARHTTATVVATAVRPAPEQAIMDPIRTGMPQAARAPAAVAAGDAFKLASSPLSFAVSSGVLVNLANELQQKKVRPPPTTTTVQRELEQQRSEPNKNCRKSEDNRLESLFVTTMLTRTADGLQGSKEIDDILGALEPTPIREEPYRVLHQNNTSQHAAAFSALRAAGIDLEPTPLRPGAIITDAIRTKHHEQRQGHNSLGQQPRLSRVLSYALQPNPSLLTPSPPLTPQHDTAASASMDSDDESCGSDLSRLLFEGLDDVHACS